MFGYMEEERKKISMLIPDINKPNQKVQKKRKTKMPGVCECV